MSGHKHLASLNTLDRINYWSEKLITKKNTPTIAFAVVDTLNTTDYIRAKNLSIEFIKLGWNIVFLSRLKREWYELDPEIDILMTFSDLYDLTKIETHNNNLIKIAWASRWYQQWRNSPYLDQYLMIIGNNENANTEPQTVSDNFLFHLPLTPEVENEDYNKLTQRITEEIKNRLTKPTISLKIPARNWNGIHNWGDYHFAVLLKQQLDLKGFFVYLHVQSEWYGAHAEDSDISIVLRGLRRHTVIPTQINIMWNISHPDSVTVNEYEDYDHIFIASTYWAKKIASECKVPVEPLLQCTDTSRFYPPSNTEKQRYRHELLFVGNSRGIFRAILKDLLPTEHNLAIYGEHPINEIPNKYLIDTYLPNEKLYRQYGSADILLNDHWDDMKDKGFISNRIYDGLASGAFIISDKVKHMNELEEYIVTYKSADELKKLVAYYLLHPSERKKITEMSKHYIEKNHTFEIRADKISTVITQLIK